ncbi:hypothetical protein LINPERPRIM_LOCUS11223 [Linum perenne]
MSAYTDSLIHSLFLLLLLVLLLSSASIRFSEATTAPQGEMELANGYHSGDAKKMLESMMEPVKMVEMRLMLNDSRRRLNSFQMCALCTCCGGGSKRYCLPSPCCYAINCNIPNRPFGYCSFTPKTCNCFGCHV